MTPPGAPSVTPTSGVPSVTPASPRPPVYGDCDLAVADAAPARRPPSHARPGPPPDYRGRPRPRPPPGRYLASPQPHPRGHPPAPPDAATHQADSPACSHAGFFVCASSDGLSGVMMAAGRAVCSGHRRLDPGTRHPGTLVGWPLVGQRSGRWRGRTVVQRGGLRLPFPGPVTNLFSNSPPGDRLVITAPGQTVYYRVTTIELLSDQEIQAFWECVGSGQAMLIAPYEVIRGSRLVVWAALE
ncbi:MAG: hypothetical protein KIT87_02135 [Anaerolineae bacterium]|nr:hypothetical protein [Anaerolineae bacterium]